MNLTEEDLASIRYRLATNPCEKLLAVTVTWDSSLRHLHLSYFCKGPMDEVDFDPITLGEVEIVADLPQVETSGVSYVFDALAADEALRNPGLVFRR
ncbi:hypothetical protein [Phenylobacterium aquaticum]|uniref:hypothetical protein n=1 Tax=Phenylobacterium aquaticum TaxID=1763816 RepID=UPI0026EE37AF|nr:hypothetical protein [Phenylobacterium aquaticum]